MDLLKDPGSLRAIKNMSDRTPVPKKPAKNISLKTPDILLAKEEKEWIKADLPSLIKPQIIIEKC